MLHTTCFHGAPGHALHTCDTGEKFIIALFYPGSAVKASLQGHRVNEVAAFSTGKPGYVNTNWG